MFVQTTTDCESEASSWLLSCVSLASLFSSVRHAQKHLFFVFKHAILLRDTAIVKKQAVLSLSCRWSLQVQVQPEQEVTLHTETYGNIDECKIRVEIHNSMSPFSIGGQEATLSRCSMIKVLQSTFPNNCFPVRQQIVLKI